MPIRCTARISDSVVGAVQPSCGSREETNAFLVGSIKMESEVHHGLVGMEHQTPFMNSSGKDSGCFNGFKRECDGGCIRSGSKLRYNLLHCDDALKQGFKWFVNVDNCHQGLAICFSVVRCHGSIRGLEMRQHGQWKVIAESSGSAGKDSQVFVVNCLDDLCVTPRL